MVKEDAFPVNTTLGAMEVQSQEEADAYFEKCVEHMMRIEGCSREEAIRIEKSNLGYFAGYYDSETRERVERLFRCSHPIFGSIAENGEPSPEEAFNAGVDLAERMKNKK